MQQEEVIRCIGDAPIGRRKSDVLPQRAAITRRPRWLHARGAAAVRVFSRAGLFRQLPIC